MKNHIIAYLAYLFLFTIYCTQRIIVLDRNKNALTRKDLLELLKRRKIIGFYHQDESVLIPFFRNSKTGVMVSSSKDGKLMQILAKLFGYSIIEGSSSKSPVKALASTIKALKSHQIWNFSFAVDGPKGPIYKVKPGIILTSQKCQIPILPVRVSGIHKKIFEKSWNKSRLYHPFRRINVHIGELKIYENAEQLEQELNFLN